VRQQRYDQAASMLRSAVDPSLDFTAAQSLCRLLRQIRPRSATQDPPVKLAVLSNHTTSELVRLIDLFLFAGGLDASIYQPEYGTFTQEVLDPNSQLYYAGPQFIFFATGWRDLAHPPALGQSRFEVQASIQAEITHWSSLWNAAHARLGCQIIQNNFDLPPWRSFDNHELREPSSLAGFIARLNISLADEAPPFVTIHDLDHLSASCGRWVWGDESFFHLAKFSCAPECQVGYAHNVASLILAHQGRSKKCLVLDLDNTLWGGVIGDDGLGGIRLGQGNPEGEAFLAFQRYAKNLRSRGIILAVCSKNEHETAKAVFDKHPEMVLRFEDIACFIANWQDKASNLRTIAARLNIGLDSLVFVDDNPAERALVRQLAPEVAVPELPADPVEYIHAVDRHHFFQAVASSHEDFRRADLYRENAVREAAQQTAGTVEEFLKSLQMVANIEPINEFSLERSVQLINKSNQFNLTTQRYTSAQILTLLADPQWITRTISLVDRFGDNGLISVLIARIQDDALNIDTWLMSCRVLKRGVEQLALNTLSSAALEKRIAVLRGTYIPTSKNGLVAHHYSDLGFEQISCQPDGTTTWSKCLKNYRPLETSIEVRNGR
jgi:FkbH-like protein